MIRRKHPSELDRLSLAGWMLLLLLLFHLQPGQAATAYLVGTMEQPFTASNNSFNSLRGVLQQLDTYDTIVLTDDYAITDPKQFQQTDPIRLPGNLLITSAPRGRYQLSFAFLSNVVLMNNKTVTLRDIVVHAVRKSSGQSVPFFAGEGVLLLEDVVRSRLACLSVVNATINTLRTTPRPPAAPGVQQVQLITYYHRGTEYPNSVHAEDVALFVSPGDVEDAAYLAGYSVLQRNVTRVCERYLPASCNEQCLQQTVESILAAQAAAADSGTQQGLVGIVVPAVLIPVVVLLAAALAGFFWHRRRKAAKAALRKQQAKLDSQLDAGSAMGYSPNGSSFNKRPGPPGSSGMLQQQQLAPHGPGVPVGVLGRSLDRGAVGSIEEVAVGGGADGGTRKGWQLMACHTAPEFPEATAKDAITLGVLLGAGSFGRVYRGRWRGLDVAVKVLHHDSSTAASVANEVDLVMSFRHPNITAAYHFLTWNYAHDTGEIHTSGSLATRTTPEQSAAATIVPGVSGAAGSSLMGPATPSLTRRDWGQAGRGSEVVTPSVAVGPQEQPQQQQQQQHLSASGTGHAGLFVIQSQIMSSSALAGAAGSGTAQQAFTERSGASGAVAASGAARSWGHTHNNSSGSSGGSGGLNSSSSGALAMSSSSSRRGLQVEPVSNLYGPLPLLPNQQATVGSLQPQQAPAAALLQAAAASGAHSPDRGSAAASTTAATAAASSPMGSAASCGTSTAAPAVAGAVRNAGSQSEAGAASSAAQSGSPSGLAALAPGALSPDTGSTASWVPQRLMPMWGSRMASPGQVPSNWSSLGTTSGAVGNSTQGMGATLASTRTDEQPTQDQQQPQLSQQPSGQQQQQQQQQEFVPMVPYRLGQHQQQSLDGQQQYGQYVPLIQMPEEHGQQPQQPPGQRRLSDCSSATTRSQPQLSGQQRQQRQHPRAVQRFDAGSGGSSYFGSKAQSGEAQTWLILEFCDGGTLLDLMQEGLLFSSATGLLNMAHVLTLLADIAGGMEYLHQRNCVHGDLKPANVLLRKQQGAPFGHVAKVSDFGLSKSLTAGQSHRSTRTLGTFNRAPPELLRLGRLSPACDVYAFGIMMWELYTGHVAFSGAHYGEVFERVALLQERPPIPPDMPADYAALMVACWHPDPLARPTFRVVQQSLAEILKVLPNGADRFFSDL